MANAGGKVVLVTGASSGIGSAVAKTLAGAGYRVFGTSRSAKDGDIVEDVEQVRLDVTDDVSASEAIATVIARAGRLDVLVNNAGLGVVGAAGESSIDQAKAIFETNVFGVIRMTRAALPHMREQRSGTIVNMSSVLGFIPAPFAAIYAATKHAVEGYSESIDHELRGSGIRAISIEPAYTRTPFDKHALEVDAPLEIYAPARERARDLAKNAIEKADEPEVVARAVLDALRAKHLKQRYTAGALAKRLRFARRFLPTSAFDKALRKSMGLSA